MLANDSNDSLLSVPGIRDMGYVTINGVSKEWSSSAHVEFTGNKPHGELEFLPDYSLLYYQPLILQSVSGISGICGMCSGDISLTFCSQAPNKMGVTSFRALTVVKEA